MVRRVYPKGTRCILSFAPWWRMVRMGFTGWASTGRHGAGKNFDECLLGPIDEAMPSMGAGSSYAFAEWLCYV